MKLDYISVNKYSMTPLYDQIRTSILEAIKNGTLVPGDKLPTEEEICKHFGVSRPVVRQAYSELTKDGYLARERGKGTFVREIDNRGIFMQRITTFKEEMQMLGKEPKTIVLKTEVLDFDVALFRKLDIPEDGSCYYLERMRYSDGKAFEHCINYLPLDRFPGLEKYDFGENSLYEILRSEYEVIITRAKRSIRAERVKPKLAEYLEISKNSAILVIESLVYDQYDRPVEVSVESIAGDCHRYDFEVFNN